VTKDPRVYLAHILECIQKIERFTADGRERFFRDAMVQDAVLHNFEVIGEAVKRLYDAYRAAHPEVPWRALGGLHDVLIHQYEGVDLEKLWAIGEKKLSPLRAPSPPCCRPSSSWNVSWPGRTNRRRSRDRASRARARHEDTAARRAGVWPCTTWSDRPALYGGARVDADHGMPFDDTMGRPGGAAPRQQAGAAELDGAIAANLEELGYDA
jgi:uncharacterized protein with HEPN domain